MLRDEDRIFTNLYNDFGSDVDSSQKRGDWKDTKEIIRKGKELIINGVHGICRLITRRRTVDTYFSSRYDVHQKH